MYFLARRWSGSGPGAALASVLYTFDGIMQTSLMWPNNIAALGLLPWVIMVVQLAWRRGGPMVLLAAMVSALQLLTGAPEMIVITWVFVMLALAHDTRGEWRRVLRCGAVIGVAALLAAAQLIPFLDLLVHSARMGDQGGIVTAHVHWYSWANFFLPRFENYGLEKYGGFMHASQHWTHSYYLGYAPWLLLGPALFRHPKHLPRNLTACGFFAMILALGPDGRLYTWADAILPMDLMRFPVKYLTFLKVLMPLLAAWGIRRLSLPWNERALRVSVVAVGLLIGGAIWMQYNLRLPISRSALSYAQADVLTRLGWLIAMVIVLFLVVRRHGQSRRLAMLGVVALAGFEMLFHQPELSPTVSADHYHAKLKQGELLESARHPAGRIVPGMPVKQRQDTDPLYELSRIVPEMRLMGAANANLLDGIPLVGGFYSLHLPRYEDIFEHVFIEHQHLDPPLADFIGITHTTTGSRSFRWVKREHAEPLVTVGRQPEYTEAAKILEWLTDGLYDPRREVLLHESSKSAFGSAAAPGAELTVHRTDPHHIEFTVNSSRPTVATVAQIHYHWWQAEVDGEPTEIHLANHAFQAIPVPAGERRVVLRYVDQGFRIGTWISLLTLGGVLVGWWWLRRYTSERKLEYRESG